MKSRIVELYVDGQRIPRAEALAAVPIEGELMVSDRLDENASGRPLRMADLMQVTPSCKYPLLRPLFEPTILCMKAGEGGFVFRGWQIEVKTVEGHREIREVAQEWWIRI